MRTYTICFEITGGISVEAENEEEYIMVCDLLQE